jgi:hypothetical protein
MKPVIVRQSCGAPVDVLWDVATDLAQAPANITGITRTEVLTDGGVGVGTRWRETRTMLGREATETMEITAVEPGRSYTAEAHSSGMHYVTRWEVAATDTGSEIVMTFSGEPASTIGRLASRVFGAMNASVEKAMRKDMADIARAAEART